MSKIDAVDTDSAEFASHRNYKLPTPRPSPNTMLCYICKALRDRGESEHEIVNTIRIYLYEKCAMGMYYLYEVCQRFLTYSLNVSLENSIEKLIDDHVPGY